MLKSIKRRSMRAWALILSLVMILSVDSPFALTAKAEESQTIHTLDIAELANYVDETFENGVEYPVTNNDYFTIIGGDSFSVSENSKTFTDSEGNTYSATHRIQFGGSGNASKRAIKFTTASKASLIVYWGSGGNGRQMYLLDRDNNQIVATNVESVKNSLYVSEMSIAEAGTYYLCGVDGSNYVYGLKVVEDAGGSVSGGDAAGDGGSVSGGNAVGDGSGSGDDTPAEIPTSWDLTYTGGYTADVQGTDVEYQGLLINGKLGANQNANAAQLANGYTIKIPVTGASKITVVAYSAGYAYFKIGNVTVSGDCAEAVYNYSGEAGYVTLTSTGDTYLKSIAVSEVADGGNEGGDNPSGGEDEGDDTITEIPDSWTFEELTALEGKTGEFKGLLIDATTGKLAYNPGAGSAQFNQGTIIKVPVTGTCTITVEAHSTTYAKYTIGGEKASDTSAVSTYAYVGGEGYVSIVSTGESYIKSISVSYPAGSQPTEMIFDVGDMESFAKGKTEGTEIVNGDFTLLCHSNSAIEDKTVAFENYTSTKRLSLGGSLATTKAAIKFTTAAAAEVTVYWVSGGDTREIKIIDANGKQKAITSVGSKKDVAYVSVLNLEEAGTYLLGSSSSSNYIFRIIVKMLGDVTNPTVNAVTAVQDAEDNTGATVNVSFTGTAGSEGTNYVVEASKDDGANWTRVGTVEGTKTEGSFTVDLSDEKLGYGTWKFCVRGENEVVAAETIVYEAATYVLSGTYNTGLSDAVSALTGLAFKAVSESIYQVPAVTLDTTNYTYSVVLEKGTTYEVAAVGVDEYSIINPSSTIKYSADTTLNIEFKQKVFYPITISLGSTPDLSGKNVTYTFVHEDGTKYSFSDASAITLRDGVYTVSMGGDMEQMAYGIKTGGTLTVSGAAVNHAITFEELTSWTFAGSGVNINGSTGYYKGLYVDATTGKLVGREADAQFNQGAIIKVPVSGACTISVTANGGGQYALYTINGDAAATDTLTTTCEYTGAAGTIDIVATGTAYIASITLTYPVKDVEFVEQTVMPVVPADDTDANTAADSDGKPRQNKADAMTVQPVGQKLNLSQTGGSFADKFADTKDVTYYLFPKTADLGNVLEFDLVVTESKATGNEAGFFGGLFTDNYVYSIGLRAGGQKIRGIYSKNGGLSGGSFAGAGSPAEELVGLNREIHYKIIYNKSTAKPEVVITFLDDSGVLQTRSWTQGAVTEPDGGVPTEFYYGFALANISATITNMVYKDASGNVLYDQNACYYTSGAAPVASTVNAVAAESREYIDITWTGTVPEGDGTYVVEVQKDGGDWVELNQDVIGFSYRYVLPAGDGGNYKFRVCGQLGKGSLGGDRNDFVVTADSIYVMAALKKPVVSISASANDISISWDAISGAEYYQVYKYSFDEGADAAVCVVDKLTTTSYKDTNVVAETPYYYQVMAVSETANNKSPKSDVVWQVPTAGHTGDYVYEDEATEIFITKKSYDTVFTNKVVLEGNVYGDGTLAAVVNGETVESKVLSAKDAFSFELAVAAGRNDVNLLFTDKAGNVTRKTYNFVYLTNYDMVVDASHTGTDGEAVNGIPTYKTVQAAVNAVPSNNSDSKVILVMAGSYEERLEVSSPYVTLIGEDRENTLIHYYPGVLGSKYEAGGDMDKRCATVIKSTATGFTAENISFANDYVYSTNDGKSNKSADAIRVEADNSAFVNVKFVGVQDTLYMHSGKQYYYKCVIEGLVDFIYSGEKARAFFNDCEIRYVYESTKTSGYVSAPKTDATADYGLTFYNCTIIGEEGCAGNGYLLARPWGPDAYITWIDCYMGKVINTLAPYNSMNGNMPADARFFEFGTYGPGFAINPDRRQISPAKAEEMISAGYLGWNPANVVAALSADHYVGNVETDRDDQFATDEREDNTYLQTDGDDTGLKMYDMEGYADAYGVTGGGLLKETNENYYKVASANEFLDALLAVKSNGKNSVIELTADINLGCNEIENYADYKSVIKAYNAQPLTHPTLIESGVSVLTFDKLYNLTIFSKNGASIKHANITMKNSENIIIRNIKFDELWEWDEITNGDYDRNDWDYMTIDSGCDGIWIDHCTFYKAYDGIVDVKNPANLERVTISWCEFLPGSEDNVFFDVMMDDVYNNPDKYPTTYQYLKAEGMTDEQVYMYAYGVKKTHLLGQSDDSTNAVGIRVTLANNYYLNCMDRMPRLRYGDSHVYNCIMDAQELLDVRLSIKNEDIAKKIVSNGAASTCGAQVLLENCFISGIQNALNSGNGSSPSGYINAINSLYYMDGIKTELAPKCNSTGDTRVLITDADEFKSKLPYSDYVLYDASELNGIVKYYAGAGKLNLTTLQWEKTSYNAEWQDPELKEDPIVGDDLNGSEGEIDPDSTAQPTVEPTTEPTAAPTAEPEEEAPTPTEAPAPTEAPVSPEEDTDLSWDEIQDITSDKVEEMEKQEPGQGTEEKEPVNINFTRVGKAKLPVSILHTIKGKNMTVAIQSGDGIALSITGKDLKNADLGKLNSVDMTINTNKKAIPEAVVAQKPAIVNRQVSIGGTEKFDVHVNLHTSLGTENAGKFANLYRYNPEKGVLEFCSSFRVTRTGQAMFAMPAGGDYLITVTNGMVKESVRYTGGYAGSDYIVQPGDNLTKISRRFNTTIQKLLRNNPGLTNPDMIKPGDVLNVD